VRGLGDQGKERLDTAVPPQLVGSSAEPVPLTDSANVVQIRVGSPMGPADRTARARSPRVYLALEKVTGSSLGAGSYAVHVNGSEDGDPAGLADRRAGRISMFGVMEASRRDNEHAGSGVTFAFDITDIVTRLEATSEWDPAQVHVTITPESEPAPGAESDAVQVGRIAVYYR
jgi:tyrosinase